MLRPSPAELLAGVADALAADVVGEVPAGPARDQLQAAIAIVRRVARTLPGYTASLLADLDELRAALLEQGVDAGDVRLDGRAPLEELLAEDLRLRGLLAGVAASPTGPAEDARLRAALRRLTEREAALRQSPWER